MTNVSKQQVSSSDYQEIKDELINLITKLDKKSATGFLTELLTETEQIMLIKRFGAIFMFTQGHTAYRVSHTLGLSIPTASRLSEQYNLEHYEQLLSGFNKKETSRFLRILNNLILSQVSPKARTRLIETALNK